MTHIKKILIFIIAVIILVGASIPLVSWYVMNVGEKYVYTIENVRPGDAIIVLGAQVFPDGSVSPVLEGRLNCAIELYNMGKAPKIIVSGDHGQDEYDEVNAMRNYLLDKNIPSDDVFMDHAGFNTYASIYRAKDVFLIQNPIIVSDWLHVIRASYIAKMLGMDTAGVRSDPNNPRAAEKFDFREYGARYKAFWDCLFHIKPKLLGDTIPVSGSGEATLD